MKYHGAKDETERKNYICDFSIDEESKELTIITGDGREFTYPCTKENIEILENVYQEQSDTAIAKIPTYKINRTKANVLSAVSGLAGGALITLLMGMANAEPMITIAGTGAVVVGAALVSTEVLIQKKILKPNDQKLNEALHFQLLKKYGDSILSYVEQSDNAFTGFPDERKEQLLDMIKEGIDPTSILEVDGVGLTKEEIRRFTDNMRTEKTYCFVNKVNKAK